MNERFTWQTSSAALAALFLSASLGAPSVYAAVPVEESQEETTTRVIEAEPLQRPERRRTPSLDIPPTIEPGANETPPTVTTTLPQTQTQAGSGGLTDLFYQLQVLQQEIQNLRGQVEDQAYQIQRLQQQQKDQYLDLDSRMMALSSSGPVPAPQTTAPDPTETPVSSAQPTNERDAYRQAFEAMRQQQFDTSMAAFQQLISDYPNGQYTPNAFYWIGEIFLVANQDLEQARQAFAQVVNLHPDHQKAPDAMYKLAVVYSTLADNETALRFLNRVQSEYPNAPAAGLARKLSAELQP